MSDQEADVLLKDLKIEKLVDRDSQEVVGYFDALSNIQTQLKVKLYSEGVEQDLSPRERSILVFISDHPGSKSGEVSQKLDIPSPTVKRILAELTSKGLLEKFGVGPGTNYSIS